MRKPARCLVWLAVAGIALWVARFPSPERVIRKSLEHLARSASFSPNEGALARLARAQSLGDYFSTNVDINLTIPHQGDRRLADRDEIVQAVAARSQVNALTVDFTDITINVSPDKQSAIVELTLQARVSGDADFIIQEMNFTLRINDGRWLITRVRTVPVFSWSTAFMECV